MTHPIPAEALDDRLAFVGTTGSGKTYNSGSTVERILDGGGRVVIPDPLGVWYGLRLKPDGETPSPYDVVIFGGPHGDLPVNEHAGALIGETVAGMAESAIIDLSDFGTAAAERRFMYAFLSALYRHASGEPVHLIFDEADMWAPQRVLDKDGDANKLLGRMETVVRRGRIKGFIPWLITQRPAVLSKNVLSQVDGLVAFKLTSSQDRDALGAWVDGQADKQEWQRIREDLPRMPRGTGIVWLPARHVLNAYDFPAKRTFDSSKTPVRGEAVKTATLEPLDLPALRGRMASIEEEVKASDPRTLKARIKELERARGADPKDIETARQEGYDRGHADGYRTGRTDMVRRLQVFTSDIAAEDGAPVPVSPPVERPPILRSRPRQQPAPNVEFALGAERRILKVLAQRHPTKFTEAQWATIAGMKRTGGTWGTYKSRLRVAGCIEQDGNLWGCTPTGMAAAGEIEPEPQGPQEVLAMWLSKLGGERRMLTAIIEQGPLDRESLARVLDMSVTGGTFGTYLSRLRANGLITESGGFISASEELS